MSTEPREPKRALFNLGGAAADFSFWHTLKFVSSVMEECVTVKGLPSLFRSLKTETRKRHGNPYVSVDIFDDFARPACEEFNRVPYFSVEYFSKCKDDFSADRLWDDPDNLRLTKRWLKGLEIRQENELPNSDVFALVFNYPHLCRKRLKGQLNALVFHNSTMPFMGSIFGYFATTLSSGHQIIVEPLRQFLERH